MSPSITFSGVDNAIYNLNYKNKRALKYKFVSAIRNIYKSENQFDEITDIDTDKLIGLIWETEDPKEIRSKRINFNSIKAAVNSDLKKIYDKGLNLEGLTVSPNNTFEMSAEAKDHLLESFVNSIKADGKLDYHKVSQVLNMVNSFLEESQSTIKDSESEDVINKIQAILNNLSTKIVDTKGDQPQLGEDERLIIKPDELIDDEFEYVEDDTDEEFEIEGLDEPGDDDLEFVDSDDDAEEFEVDEEEFQDLIEDELDFIDDEDEFEIDDDLDDEEYEEIEIDEDEIEDDDEIISEADEEDELEFVDEEDDEEFEIDADIDDEDYEEIEIDEDEIEEDDEIISDVDDEEELEYIDDEDDEEFEIDADIDDEEYEEIEIDEDEIEDGDEVISELDEEEDDFEFVDDEDDDFDLDDEEIEDEEYDEFEIEEEDEEFDFIDDEDPEDLFDEDIDDDDYEEIEIDEDELEEEDEIVDLSDDEGEIDYIDEDDIDDEDEDSYEYEDVDEDEFEEIEIDEDDEEIEYLDEDDDVEYIDEDDDYTEEEIDPEDDYNDIVYDDEDDDVEYIDEDDYTEREIEDDDIEYLDDDEGYEDIDDEDLEEIDEDDFESFDDDEVEIEEIDDDDEFDFIDDEEEDDDLEFEELDDEEFEEFEEDEFDEDYDFEAIDDDEVDFVDEEDDFDLTEADEEYDDLELEEDELEDFDILDDDSDFSNISERNRIRSEKFDEFLGSIEKHYNQFEPVPAGRYYVGTKNPSGNELIEQRITLPDIYMGKFPVTNSLFEIFVQKTGYITTAEKNGFGKVYDGRYKKIKDKKTGKYKTVWNSTFTSKNIKGATWFQPNGPGSNLHNKRNNPVVQVSFDDCAAFSKWVGKRLPTEFEWEGAARTKKALQYPWGNSFDNSACNLETSEIADTSQVDQFPNGVNRYNIFDLIGNVMEWTRDETEPPYRSDDSTKYFIVKGGSFISDKSIKLYSRSMFKRDFSSNILGFRCVLK